MWKLFFEKNRTRLKQVVIAIFSIFLAAFLFFYDSKPYYSEISVMENTHSGVSDVISKQYDFHQSFHSDIDFVGIGLYLATYSTRIKGDYVSHLYSSEGDMLGEAILNGNSIRDNVRYKIVYGDSYPPGDYCFDIVAKESNNDTLVIWWDNNNPYADGAVIAKGLETNIDWSFNILSDTLDIKALVWSEIRLILLVALVVYSLLAYFNRTIIHSNVLLFGVILSIILAAMEVAYPRKYELYMAIVSLITLLFIGQRNAMKEFATKHKLLMAIWMLYLLYSYLVLDKVNITYYYGYIGAFLLLIVGYLFDGIPCNIKKKYLFQVWLVLFAIIVCGVICYHVGFDPIGEFLEDTYRYYRNESRLVGPFVHPTMCAGFIIISLILGLIVVKDKALLFVSSVMQMYALILTSSRMAWGAMALCFFVCVYIFMIKKGYALFMKMDKKQKTIAIVAMSFLGAASVVAVLLSPLGQKILQRTIYNPLSQDTSAGYRMYAAKTIMRIFSDNTLIHKILGCGILSGNQALWVDPEYMSAYGQGAWPVDNGYLSLFYDFGIIGMIMVGITIFIAARIVFDKRNDYRDMLLALLLLLLAVTMATYDMLYFTNISYFEFVLVGMVLRIYDRNYRVST